MRIAWISATRRNPVTDGEISWAQEYERRMRKFNLEVILFAVGGLAISIPWLFFGWWDFAK
jgi:hypothetical protein